MLILPEKFNKIPDNLTSSGGPGSYSPERPFGFDAKIVKIEGPWREPRPNKIPGPGEYNPDRADSQTKARVPVVIF